MKDIKERKALLIYLVKKMKAKGSWCGETHIQKIVFFLQELYNTPIGYDFILYKHGPFSFDLRDELTSMRADGLLCLEPRHPYGSSYKLGDFADIWHKTFSEKVENLCKKADYIVDLLANKTVKELERLATALYIKKENTHDSNKEDMVDELTHLKPHITKSEAIEAFGILEKLFREPPVPGYFLDR